MSLDIINDIKSIFRHLAICHPFTVRRNSYEMLHRSSTIHRKERNRNEPIAEECYNVDPLNKRILLYSLGVGGIAIISNITVFFEFTTFHDVEKDLTIIKPSALRLSSNYVSFFKIVIETGLLNFLPLLLLLYLSCGMVVTLTKRRINGQSGTSEKFINVTLASAFLFLLFNAGRAVVNIGELYNHGKIIECIELSLGFKVN